MSQFPPSPNGPQTVYFGQRGYLQMLADILEYGCDVPDRTGVGRRKLFMRQLRFDMRDGFPLPTYRSAPPRIGLEEFWLFLSGNPYLHTELAKKGITIWEGNTTREFLDNRGLTFLPEGHGGKSYSFQMRHFNGEYDENYMPTGGTDQVARIFNTLRDNPFDSRIILSLWNPAQEDEMALPPCWYGHQFLVTLDKDGNKLLNLTVNARSADTLFGTPFNVTQYAAYLCAMAEVQGMIAGELVCNLTDAHLYGKPEDLQRPAEECREESQFHFTKEMLEREFSEEPVTLKFAKPLKTFEDFLSLTAEDFIFENYHPNLSKFKTKRPKMAV